MKIKIIDFSVLCYKITDILSKKDLTYSYEKALNKSPEKKESFDTFLDTFVKLIWVDTIERGPDYLDWDPFVPIVVLDSKPYWRSKFYSEYKLGRKDKPQGFHSVKQIGLRVCKKLNYPVFSFNEYEADDIAAAIVKIKLISEITKNPPKWQQTLSQAHIGLWTVDSDWHQLVGPGVTWYNMGPWPPLIRGPMGVREWAQRRLKVTLDHPQDIVPIKCMEGDKSDNLAPNSPPFLIDLLNPHPDYRLLENSPFITAMRKTVENPVYTKETRIVEARKHLLRYL